MTRTRRGGGGDAGGGVVLGVDLGTCYSAAAVCLDGVDVEVLHNDIGDPTTPTCVYVDADGADRQVGEAAVRLAVSDPGRTVRNVKRILGVTLDAIRRDPAGVSDALGSVQVVPADGLGADRAAVRLGSALDLTPEEIAGSVLLELRKAAEARVGRAVRRAVVAVPGYFNAAQRSAVRDAAALAGLEDVRLVNETSAAALAYAHGREGQGPRNVVVVDVGGGGAAVSIVEVRNDFVRVLASSGVRLPGGEDFDREMVEYLKQVVKEEHGKDVTDPRSLELLRAHWERAKRKLMQLPHTKIDTFLPGEVDVELCRLVKRAEFEERCEPLFRRVAEQLRATLQDAEVGVGAVHDVVLVGGSTRIPRLRALVQEVVAGRPLCKALNADEAVARGAALLGEDLVRLQDVTPLQLAALGGDPLLRNSPLPADGRMPGADSGDTVVVRQGCLGGPDDADAALTVVFEATRASASLLNAHAFRLDESGLLHFVDERGGDVGEFCLRGCLSAAALADLRAGTERRQRSNLANLERAEAKNRLEERCRALLAAENEVADDQPDAAALREECEGLMRWLYSEEEQRRQPDVHEYRRRLQGVEGLQEKLAACRVARERVDAARKALDAMCLDVMDREAEVADDHPDAAQVRELRQECEGHLTWLQRQEACTERDVVERREAVEVQCLRLQKRREAAAARSDLEERCSEILGSELKDFAGLSHTCQSTLRWLNDTGCAPKEECERRLASIERRLPDARAAAATAKAAADAARALEVKCKEILGGEWKGFPALARECKLQLEWLDRNPRAAETDYISRERDVERSLAQAKAAHNKAIAEAAGRAEPASRPGPGPSYASVARNQPAHGGSRGYKARTIRSGNQRRETPPYARGDCDGESDTSPLRESEEAMVPGPGGAAEAEVAALELVRGLYRGVFNEETRRRRSHLRQTVESARQEPKAAAAAVAAGPRVEWGLRRQDDVLRALARQVAAEALHEARAAGRVALLVDEVAVPGRCVLTALTARYVRGESDRAPVERLLLLQDAYLTSGAGLMRRLDELAAAEGGDWLAAAVCGVSWEQDRGGLVGAAGQQLLQLVRDRRLRGDAAGPRQHHHDPDDGCGPGRLWGGGHSLDRRIADECGRQHQEARHFLDTLSRLWHLFDGPRFCLLRRSSQAATAPTWTSAWDALHVVARPGGLESVVRALRELRALEPSPAIDSLLDSVGSAAFMACARIFGALSFAVRDVGKLLAFCGPTDVSVVERWPERFWSRLRAHAAAGAAPRLRFESSRRLAELAGRLLASARAAVQACVDECAVPLWLRRAVATGEDAPLQVPDGLRRDVLADLARCREQLGARATDPRSLVAAFPRAHFQKYFPALEEGLVAMLTRPLIPCAAPVDEVHGDVGGPRRHHSACLLRDAVLGLGLGPYGSRAESLLEPVMTLLSSTEWSAAYDFGKDVSGVLKVLAPA